MKNKHEGKKLTAFAVALWCGGLMIGYAISASTAHVDAQIVEPPAVKFLTDNRSIAEKLRGLNAEIDGIIVTWFGGINAQIPAGSDVIEDDRSDGRNAVDADEMIAFVNTLLDFQTFMDVAGRDGIVSELTVRPLRVE